MRSIFPARGFTSSDLVAEEKSYAENHGTLAKQLPAWAATLQAK